MIEEPFIKHYAYNSWGDEILLMEKHGYAFARIYWFHDDPTSVYLDQLSVSEIKRKQRLGTELQEIREFIGRVLKADTAFLWVEKDTWMHKWYQRRGYTDWKDHEDEENAVWMRKELTNK